MQCLHLVGDSAKCDGNVETPMWCLIFYLWWYPSVLWCNKGAFGGFELSLHVVWCNFQIKTDLYKSNLISLEEVPNWGLGCNLRIKNWVLFAYLKKIEFSFVLQSRPPFSEPFSQSHCVRKKVSEVACFVKKTILIKRGRLTIIESTIFGLLIYFTSLMVI